MFEAGVAHGLPDRLKYKEPITVVNFWATWCPPCVEEFPAMMELQRQLEGQGLEILFVSVDEDWTKVPAFLKDYQIEVASGRMLWDPERSGASAWGSAKFPETFVVRRDGWVLEKIVGAQQWTRPAVVDYFRNLIAEHSSVQGTLSRLSMDLVLTAWAQPTQALIHEDDKKNLEKLRSNIEVASSNLQKIEAAQREESRNLSEQQIVLGRRKSAEDQARADLEALKNKKLELQSELGKTQTDKKAEELEKRRVEAQLSATREKIQRIEKELEQAKSELVQVNKALQTRVQAIETFEKAAESATEQLNSLEGRVSEGDAQLRGRLAETKAAERELAQRQQRLTKIDADLEKARSELDRQKSKLKEFEELLKK